MREGGGGAKARESGKITWFGRKEKKRKRNPLSLPRPRTGARNAATGKQSICTVLAVDSNVLQYSHKAKRDGNEISHGLRRKREARLCVCFVCAPIERQKASAATEGHARRIVIPRAHQGARGGGTGSSKTASLPRQ